jgi:proteasome alpha subunit
MMPNQSKYDNGIMYSPEGRIFQVEYAREAIKKGVTVIGINAIDGILIATDKRSISKLIKPSEKIFKIDDNIVAAPSGMTADANEIIETMRMEAQVNKLTYDEPINTQTIVKKICKTIHSNTRFAGSRPLGVSLLIAGIDDNKTSLYETDPSGAFWECTASVIGAGKEEITHILEEKYHDGITIEESVTIVENIFKESYNKPEIYVLYNP